MGSKGRDYGLVKAKHFFIPSLLYMKKLTRHHITGSDKKFLMKLQKKITEW